MKNCDYIFGNYTLLSLSFPEITSIITFKQLASTWKTKIFLPYLIGLSKNSGKQCQQIYQRDNLGFVLDFPVFVQKVQSHIM